jgi:hypothetical protein
VLCVGGGGAASEGLGGEVLLRQTEDCTSIISLISVSYFRLAELKETTSTHLFRGPRILLGKGQFHATSRGHRRSGGRARS